MASSLVRKCRVAGGVAVDHADDDAGEERAEDALQPEPLGQRGERDQQHHREPHPDLRGRVLQPDQHLAEPQRPAGPRARRVPVTATSTANRPSSDSRLPVLPSDAEKNSDSSTIAAKSATVAASDRGLPDLAVGLAGVLEHRHDQPRATSPTARWPAAAGLLTQPGRVDSRARSGRRAPASCR